MIDQMYEMVPPTVTTYSEGACGDEAFLRLGGNFTTVNPVTNNPRYYPFILKSPVTVSSLWFNNQSASGNFDIGIYSQSGTKLVSTGSTAATGGPLQLLSVTSTTLTPGAYYFAYVTNSASAIHGTITTNVSDCKMAGVLQQTAGTVFPLPAVATMVTTTATAIPLMGLSTVALL